MGKAARRVRRQARPRPIADVAARLAGYEQIAVEEYGPTCRERLDQLSAVHDPNEWPAWCWMPMGTTSVVVTPPAASATIT